MKGSSFRHDKRHALRHQAGDEGDVPGEAIQLGDNYGHLVDRAAARAAAS